ncbi:DUF998 domain-containing protein [Streptomyces sp. AV19]|uniref:DUF998 domain-containing protein n=1 Tax=Streptomyces sp. AV19 TaxID=2793068 RepID=UPI0018FE48AE|nr:DUF998 domain-containing protein [Streptomyces sp. AV19]MBH1936766.1 DUF998 domain-containing protein [Streptomyces sp. AV19]MDG4532821.1 DUF998 domain-containing protein [Streptomyces sp. AV19]
MAVSSPKPRTHLAPAAGLFVLAPLIGECLLGNLTVPEMALLLPLLAPMYGAGALLVREAARRAGRGHTSMLVLGIAYGLVEEGLADQMLFNRHYAGHDLMGDTYIPALGMGGWLTVAVVTMHAVWSTNVGIVLVESLVAGERAGEPWLGKVGLAVTAVVFAGGSALVGYGNYVDERFVASPWQLGGTAFVVVVLVVCALRVDATALLRLRTAEVPAPWAVGAAALIAGGLFLGTESFPGWWAAGAVVGLVALAAVAGHWYVWGPRHRLALAGGALLAYAGAGFFTEPESAAKGVADYVANGVLGVGAVGLLVVAGRRVGWG